MDIKILISCLWGWNALGAIGLVIAINCSTNWLGLCEGWEFVNPYWVYKYCKTVNWFGATMLALFFTLICPIGAIGYWFYKLCTVGRR